MANSGREEFAEFAATILDTFQQLFEETGHLDHRTNDAHARYLLSDLLIDLMHYAERRGLDFNDILGESRGYFISESEPAAVYPIGSTVELDGPSADEAVQLGRPTRGTVTGVFTPEYGSTEYYAHFLGEKGSQRIIGADLTPAPPFPPTPTAEGIVNNPLQAEAVLMAATTRLGLADIGGKPPHLHDLRDHRALLGAFAAWTGMDKRSLTDLLLSRIAENLPSPGTDRPRPATTDAPTAGRLAAEGFPTPLTEQLQGSSNEEAASTPRPDDRPKRQGPTR